jgi:cytochrome P450 family 33
VDRFFLEREKLVRTGGNAADFYSIAQLKGMCFDLWFAGQVSQSLEINSLLQETLSSTLTWIVAFMIAYPECQAKVHEELDRLIGSERMVTISDKPQLHYLNAVIAVSSFC